MLLIDAIINDVDVGNYGMGFYCYTSYITQFKRQVLDLIFFETYNVLILLGSAMDSGQVQLHALLELACVVISKLLNFPFEPNYATFNNETSIQDSCSTLYPLAWYPQIRCPTFINLLVRISTSSQCSPTLRRDTVTIINYLISAKNEPGVLQANIDRMIAITIDLLPGSVQSLLSTTNFSQMYSLFECLVEHCSRMFKFAKTSKLIKCGHVKFNTWMEAFILLSQTALTNHPHVAFGFDLVGEQTCGESHENLVCLFGTGIRRSLERTPPCIVDLF